MGSSRRSTSMFRTVMAGFLLAVTAATAPGGAGGAAAAGPPADGGGGTQAGAAGRPTPGNSTHRITLVTGDVAELSTAPDGRRSAHLVGGGNHYLGDFDGDLTLVPAAAYPLFTQGRLDRRLFNLTQLVAQGYDDASTSELPVLLTGPTAPPAPANSLRPLALPSSGATAVKVGKSEAKQFWAGLTQNRTLSSSGVSKIWLDGRTKATLDRSAGQIGAPAAWRTGYDGRGVKVAVLDTGYDAGHPDLKNRVVAAESFVPGEDVQDRHGHGTHVAATVAGQGTAAAGQRKGVAPGARLLVGKVLDNRGSGLDSEAIAGMEWAVEQGAKVVNLSLGSWPTDGTDPMSAAVDRLSASSGALFVVAAGNAGAEQTVGAPGAAASALTVGAVDRDDRLAPFSSRGPRLGDGALKPEVTAPGVDIAAARAAGSDQGHQIGEHYTRMSGTSMAAPHVAGAAAILAQRHPEWSGQQLKAALTTTAVAGRGAAIPEQGLGRIDLRRALDPAILPGTGNLFFGDLSWTGSAPAPVTRKVTYSNKSGKPVTLNLTVGARSPAGVAAAVTVSPGRLAVPPGGTASATVRLDLARTSPANYAGELVARGAGTSYRTGLGFAAGGRLHQVTVAGIGRDGKPAAGTALANSGVQLWNLDTGDVNAVIFDESGRRTLHVPTGRYAVMAYVMGADEAGWANSVALLGAPETRISTDRTFVFDARKAHKVTVKTPRRTDPESVGIAWHRKAGSRSAVSGFGFWGAAAQAVYVQSFGKVADGTFQVVQRWDLAQPKLTVDVTGAGGFRLPTPRWGTFETAYVGQEKLPLVDARDGRPEDLANVRGTVALIRWRHVDETRQQVQAAKDAGARMVLLYNDQPGFWSDAAEVGIPVYLLMQPEAARLLQLLKTRTVDLDLTGLRDSTYRYDLAVGPQRVTGPLTYDFARMRPAVVTTHYHRNDAWFLHRDYRRAYLPGLPIALSATRDVTGPVTRTDYLASDVTGTAWDERTLAGEWNETGLEYSVARTYRPGEQLRREWWAPIARPAIPEGVGSEADGMPAARFENAIRVAIPQHVNGDRTVYGWSDSPGDRTQLTLSSNGRELGRKTWSMAQFPVPASAAWYDLTLDVRRAPDTWATTSTATRTTWRFHSGTAKTRTVLPLVQVDYRLSGQRLELSPAYQPGARGIGFFRTTAQVSADGKRWQALRIVPSGPRGRVATVLPAQVKHLRVIATDLAGNRIDQTIENFTPMR